MHHVANTRNAMQCAVSNVAVKARRLLVDVDEPVLLASNNDNRHFHAGIVLYMTNASGIIRAVSAALARICDGRKAISFGNLLNFSGLAPDQIFSA